MAGTTIGPSGVTFPDGSVQGSASGFAAGTAMLFKQTAAPTGWTKVTTDNDAALRVVSGTVGTGGTAGFTTAFASRTPSGSVSTSVATGFAAGSIGSTTLATSQIAGHSHLGGTVRIWDANNGYYGSTANISGGVNVLARIVGSGQPYRLDYTETIGGNGSHNHSFSDSGHSHSASSSFSGSAMDFAVKYVDIIIATKN